MPYYLVSEPTDKGVQAFIEHMKAQHYQREQQLGRHHNPRPFTGIHEDHYRHYSKVTAEVFDQPVPIKAYQLANKDNYAGHYDPAWLAWLQDGQDGTDIESMNGHYRMYFIECDKYEDRRSLI